MSQESDCWSRVLGEWEEQQYRRQQQQHEEEPEVEWNPQEAVVEEEHQHNHHSSNNWSPQKQQEEDEEQEPISSNNVVTASHQQQPPPLQEQQVDDDESFITAETVLARIESLAETVAQALDAHQMPELTQYLPPFSVQAMTAASVMTKRLTLQQCRSFTSILLVLAYCHSLLLQQQTNNNSENSNICRRTTTTREVYYFYVTHFRSQRECDAAIWDCCQLLQVPRHALGLQAGSRGWFCGDVVLYSRSSNQVVLDGRHDGCPVTADWLLPPSQRSFVVAPTTTATSILVVEKEGIYQRLVQDRFWEEHRCLLVTGKGFPDLATRAAVHCLHQLYNLPVLGLADCDPFGVLVLNCYANGSERSNDGGSYQVPLEWIGLRPSQVRHLSSSSDNNNTTEQSLPAAVFQELTSLDRKRLHETLLSTQQEHPFVNSDRRWDELQDMSDQKVELEALHWLGMDFCGVFVGQLLEHHEAKQQRLQQQQQQQFQDDEEDEDDSVDDEPDSGWKDII